MAGRFGKKTRIQSTSELSGVAILISDTVEFGAKSISGVLTMKL